MNHGEERKERLRMSQESAERVQSKERSTEDSRGQGGPRKGFLVRSRIPLPDISARSRESA